MKKINYCFLLVIFILLLQSCSKTDQKQSVDFQAFKDGQEIEMPIDSLKDKIMGGWAGQVIGVTYGGPTEFRFQGTMIQDYQPIPWRDGYIKEWYTNSPGLFDDVYMDLTFVDVFEKYGIDAPVDSFAEAFAHAGYQLWHANQAARYNILNGIMPPKSGHWLNNPHADCIDYQIEADFAGLMSPGMPNAASEISDKIGHIMNYGDGWYGGVYVGAMYSLAFISNNIEFIVNEGLKSIPENSDFYKCIHDVINVYKKDPNDWKSAWFEVEKNWTQDVGCPDGVYVPFNIDAKVNAAYIVIGLLYGKGDFGKTIDIATRGGQDSDCNPASAGGILACMYGYSKIPEVWKSKLKDVEDMNFKYTTMSLNSVYKLGLKHALQVIEKQGGKVDKDKVIIKAQLPKPVKFEKSFDGHYPFEKKEIWSKLENEFTFEFEGIGFVLKGGVYQKEKTPDMKNYIADVELAIDNQVTTKLKLPLNFTTRSNEICWKYQMPKQKHLVKLKWLNPNKDVKIDLNDLLLYTDQPVIKAL